MTNEEIIKELRKEIDKVLQTGKSLRSYRIYQYLDILEKNNSTLLECIKEWNEKGFDVDIYAVEIVISGSTIELSIDLENKTLLIEGSPLPFDLVPLIYKTIKALEKMKDE